MLNSKFVSLCYAESRLLFLEGRWRFHSLVQPDTVDNSPHPELGNHLKKCVSNLINEKHWIQTKHELPIQDHELIHRNNHEALLNNLVRFINKHPEHLHITEALALKLFNICQRVKDKYTDDGYLHNDADRFKGEIKTKILTLLDKVKNDKKENPGKWIEDRFHSTVDWSLNSTSNTKTDVEFDNKKATIFDQLWIKTDHLVEKVNLWCWSVEIWSDSDSLMITLNLKTLGANERSLINILRSHKIEWKNLTIDFANVENIDQDWIWILALIDSLKWKDWTISFLNMKSWPMWLLRVLTNPVLQNA